MRKGEKKGKKGKDNVKMRMNEKRNRGREKIEEEKGYERKRTEVK